MPKIFAITQDPQTNLWGIVTNYNTSPPTKIILGGADKTREFLIAVRQNSVIKYFDDREKGPFESWEAEIDWEGEGVTVDILLKTSTSFQMGTTTLFTAPIGRTLESAIEDDGILGINSGLASIPNRTMSQALEDAIEMMA